MRVLNLGLIVAVALGLGACDRRDSTRRDEPPARQVGREAYDLKQELKRDAKEAAKELRQAGKEAREGWNEAKQEDKTHPKK
jgi:hypothetical protein